LPTDSFLTRAGRWFVHSGIQEPSGGVARYYLADAGRNRAVSTEITGYTASALVYLHTLTHDPQYLERATAAARFLTRSAWRPDLKSMPFETEPVSEGLLSYFFDAGMIVRGLLAVWRATGEQEFLDGAQAVGCSMASDFAAGEPGEHHPILRLPEKRPLARDDRWSRSTGCYQLKPAMAWLDLADAGGDPAFRRLYDRVLDFALRDYPRFLPGHGDRLKVMDRLHAFCYFLEGLLPRASDEQCAAALREGIGRVAWHLREIAPEFSRGDVYAQLLRIRIYADWVGALPLDKDAAALEARRLGEFQISSTDPRLDGGFWFGRRKDAVIPHASPVPAAFGVQALALWEQCRAGGAQAHRHLLV
jgi:hypothetical protein